MKHIFINKNSSETFIILHGTGGDENDLVNVANYIKKDANILGIRGNINENGLNRFFRRFDLGRYDLDSYRAESINLFHAINKYIDYYNLNLSKITVLGFSNGANIALSLLNYPNFINNFILLSNDYIDKEKEFLNLENKNIIISSSFNDPYVDYNNIEMLIDKLKDKNANVYLEMINGHNITTKLLDRVKEVYGSFVI